MKTMKQQAKQAKRIRRDDSVVVISGNSKGETGKVLKRIGKDKILIQGINVCKKATRRSEANPQGGFVELERPIHASNVMLVTEDNKGFRAKKRTNGNNKEIYGVVDGKEIVHRTYTKSQSKGE